MRIWILILGINLLLTGCDGQEEHPFRDSSDWDMNQSIDQLAQILETQVQILGRLHQATPIPPSIGRELWSLSIDECAIGFECWARMARSPNLVMDFCQSLERRTLSMLEKRRALILRYSEYPVFFLQSIAPSFDALNQVGPRLQSYGMDALVERCSVSSGFKQRDWP